jgi:hypothetical protein
MHAKYRLFRTLLAVNNEVLEIVAEQELLADGGARDRAERRGGEDRVPARRVLEADVLDAAPDEPADLAPAVEGPVLLRAHDPDRHLRALADAPADVERRPRVPAARRDPLRLDGGERAGTRLARQEGAKERDGEDGPAHPREARPLARRPPHSPATCDSMFLGISPMVAAASGSAAIVAAGTTGT